MQHAVVQTQVRITQRHVHAVLRDAPGEAHAEARRRHRRLFRSGSEAVGPQRGVDRGLLWQAERGDLELRRIERDGPGQRVETRGVLPVEGHRQRAASAPFERGSARRERAVEPQCQARARREFAVERESRGEVLRREVLQRATHAALRRFDLE